MVCEVLIEFNLEESISKIFISDDKILFENFRKYKSELESLGFDTFSEAKTFFKKLNSIEKIEPANSKNYGEEYKNFCNELQNIFEKININLGLNKIYFVYEKINDKFIYYSLCDDLNYFDGHKIIFVPTSFFEYLYSVSNELFKENKEKFKEELIKNYDNKCDIKISENISLSIKKLRSYKHFIFILDNSQILELFYHDKSILAMNKFSYNVKNTSGYHTMPCSIFDSEKQFNKKEFNKSFKYLLKDIFKIVDVLFNYNEGFYSLNNKIQVMIFKDNQDLNDKKLIA